MFKSLNKMATYSHPLVSSYLLIEPIVALMGAVELLYMARLLAGSNRSNGNKINYANGQALHKCLLKNHSQNGVQENFFFLNLNSFTYKNGIRVPFSSIAS